MFHYTNDCNISPAEPIDDYIRTTTRGLKDPIEKLEFQLSALLAGHTSGQLSPVELGHQLARANNLCGKLSSVIDELEDLSAGGGWYKSSGKVLSSNLSDIVAAVLDNFVEPALENESRLIFYAPAVVIGEWSSLRLKQLVSSLIQNAIDYAPGSDIEVQVTRNEHVAFLVVTDSGPGIPLADQSKVFQRFTKLSGTTKGFGNGLWLAKQIVEHFFGTIRLVSRLGEGSSFFVELPLRQILH